MPTEPFLTSLAPDTDPTGHSCGIKPSTAEAGGGHMEHLPSLGVGPALTSFVTIAHIARGCDIWDPFVQLAPVYALNTIEDGNF